MDKEFSLKEMIRKRLKSFGRSVSPWPGGYAFSRVSSSSANRSLSCVFEQSIN